MTTLKEIAARANIHLTTVSGILNQSKSNSRCSEETRKKVLRIAAEMGYVRNQLASRLRSRRTNTVCLIAGDIRNPFFALLAAAIEEELEAGNYQMVLLCRGWGGCHQDPALIRAVFEQPVDGFIVWSESAGNALRELPDRFPKPVVTIGAPVRGYPGVRLDIGRGVGMAVEYLVGKGHRRLAYYAPEEARLKGMPQPRHKIFEKIVADAGLPAPQLIFYPGKSWDVAAAWDYAERVKLNAGITAMVGFNDVSILGWHKSAGAERVETVGFDGTDWLRLCGRSVPCVRFPARELARASVTMMLAHLAGTVTKTAKPPVVQPEFVQF
jgi:LacI family transcriptional regulator